MIIEINSLSSLIHISALIIGILLIYYAVLLLKRLKNEDFSVSMIFLHEKKINNIFLVLVIGSLIFFIGHIYNNLMGNWELKYMFLNILGIIYSMVLLYFVYGLQNILKEV